MMGGKRCGWNGCEGTQDRHEMVCVERASNGSQRYRISVRMHELIGGKWWGDAGVGSWVRYFDDPADALAAGERRAADIRRDDREVLLRVSHAVRRLIDEREATR